MPTSSERTALYRLYDAEGRLLYVGISWQPDERLQDHRLGAHKEWTQLVARRTLAWFDTRIEAAAEEITAIKREKPLYNGTHNYETAPFDPAGWLIPTHVYRKVEALTESIRSEITSGRWPQGHRIPSARTLSAASGISSAAVKRAFRILQSEGLLRFWHGYGTFVATAKDDHPKATRRVVAMPPP